LAWALLRLAPEVAFPPRLAKIVAVARGGSIGEDRGHQAVHADVDVPIVKLDCRSVRPNLEPC